MRSIATSNVRCVLGALALAACIASSACVPSPNIYGTPRTVAQGQNTNAFAIEGFSYSDRGRRNFAQTRPVLPTFLHRHGFSDRVDGGLRVAGASLGLDAKIELTRGVFDLAIDPSIYAFGVLCGGCHPNTTAAAHLSLPLLLGLNVTKEFSILLTPGVIYGVSADPNQNDGGLRENSTGFMPRLGLGFDLHVSERFSLSPEITAIRGNYGAGEHAYMYVFGVGFTFGALPSFAAP